MRGRHKRGRSRHRARQRAGETLPRRARHSECSVCCVRGSCAPDGCRPGHRAGERRMSIQSLRAAMAFLTVIPVATAEGTSGERLGRAYFAAVGALLGLVAGIAFALAAPVTSPLVAVVLILVGDVAALASMSAPRAIVALVIAGALSRWALLLVIAAVPYVRQAGLGVAAGGPHRRFDLVLGSAIAAIVCLLDWRRALAAVLVAALIAVVVGAIARRRIGGA